MDLKIAKITLLTLLLSFLGLTAKTTPAAGSPIVDEVAAKWELPSQPLGAVQAQPPVDATDSRRLALRERKVASIEAVATPLSALLESLSAEVNAEGSTPINFVLVGGVDPEISVTLKNTNAEEALDLVLEGTGLIYELKNSAVVIRPGTSSATIETRYYPMSQSLLNRIVGTSQPSGSDGKAQVGFDKARAENSLRAFFEQMGVGFGDGCGLALASGELIVALPAASQERVAELLGRFGKQQQVEIEARFMEVSEGALDELGVQWSANNSSGTIQAGTTGVGSGTSDSLRSIASAFGSTSTSSAPEIPNTLNLASGASDLANIKGTWGDYSVNGILRALSQQDGTELLSAPRVTVLSGGTANLTVAQELRYPQSYDRVNTDVGSSSSTYSSGSIITAPTPLDFTTRNVGVELQVNPIVEADGSITLNLQPEVTQFERFIDYGGQSVIVSDHASESVPSGFFQPVFNVRKVSTQVNIPNGGTVLMGGLTRSETVKVKDKVPVLGSIPFIGKAFRHEGTSTQKKNLIIFVTARLVG
jgi:general secretion pathway protein D